MAVSLGDAAGLGVEDHLLVDPAGGRAVGAADVVGLDLQPGDRVGAGGFREHQVVVLLVGVGALGVLLDPDHPLPDDPRLVLQPPLVEQVAGGVGGDVVLPGEVGQVLAAGGEHDAVDLGLGPLPGEGDLLVDLGQPRAQAADGPLERGVAADDRALPAEVPGRLVPVLDVDQPEPRALRQEDLESADVQRRGFASARGPLVSRTSVASAPSSSTTRVWLRSTRPVLASRPG